METKHAFNSTTPLEPKKRTPGVAMPELALGKISFRTKRSKASRRRKTTLAQRRRALRHLASQSRPTRRLRKEQQIIPKETKTSVGMQCVEVREEKPSVATAAAAAATKCRS